MTIEQTDVGLRAVMRETRARTLALVEELDDAQLARVVTPLLSPLIWDLGHIANFEQRWLLGDGDDELNALFNPFRQPRAGRGDLPLPRRPECLEYMRGVRERVEQNADDLDPFLVELVVQHEQQHNETMLQLLALMDDYLPPAHLRRDLGRRDAAPAAEPRAGAPAGWVEFPPGAYRVGSDATAGGFAYDNERRSHTEPLAAFAIASRPVSNGEYRAWVEAGGYADAASWSPEGRSWLASEGATMPLRWIRDGDEFLERGFGGPRPLDDRAPVTHVSWFEADAYARANAARLPSEAEWEAAASYDPRHGANGERRRYAWGDDPWRPGLANLDQLSWGTLPAGAGVAASPNGPLDMAGQVWEWTASEFAAYPGFEPFCYREYSAPFFDAGYRVLRGGSWATRARSVDNRFRNWDHPQRRQIFSGFRLARDD